MANEDKPLFNSRLLTWRQSFNPLIGLTIGRYVQLMANLSMGYFSDAQWLYLFVERRDSVLKAVKQRRISTIKKLNITVKVKNGMDGKDAENQKEYAEALIGGIDNLTQSVEHLALASFRGYSHLEKHYSNDGDVIHLEPVPQYLWAKKLPSNDWLYNAKAWATASGVPVDLENFIIREGLDAIDEIATLCFIRKAISQKDFDGFVETYGIPPLFVTMPQGVGSGSPAGTPGATIVDYYQSLAEQVISDGRGVLPFGATVTNPTAEVRSNAPFLDHIRYQDEQIVLAATSGLLTTLSAPTGMNSDQGSTHQDTFEELAEAEAMEISECLQKQLIIPALEEEFTSQDPMVEIALAHADIGDPQTIKDASGLSTAGYMIDVDELSQKTGYKLTLKPQPGQMGSQPFGGGGGQDYGQPQPDEQPTDTSDDDQPYSGNDKYQDWLGNRKQRDIHELVNNVMLSDDDAIFSHLEELEKAVR